LAIEEESVVLKTKRQFQEEYLLRKERRDAMLSSIELRESKIAKIQNAVNLSLSEIFLVVVYDKENSKWRCLPILGISYPKTGNGSLQRVKILVDWKISPKLDESSNNFAKFSPRPSRPDEFPLPSETPLSCEWTTVGELTKGNAYIVALDTKTKTPFEASLSRHWLPTDIPANDRQKSPSKEKKGAGKDKSAALSATLPIDTLCVDPGWMPIQLMKLDVSSFFHQVECVDDEGVEAIESQAAELL
jgi:hypothetical protein